MPLSVNIISSKLIIGLAAGLVALPSASCAQASESVEELSYDAETLLTPTQVERDVALAREAYERIHPGYDRYATEAELTAAWSSLIAKAEARGGLTIGELYLDMQRVLTMIRCDHTKAELPNQLAKQRNETPVYLPLRWTLIEDRAIVTYATVEGLSRGDEILAIDGRPISAMIADVAPLIPVDGFTEWSRRAGISESLEFRGGAVDHFGALMWDIKPEAILTVSDPAGNEREVAVKRVTHKRWTEIGKLAPGAPVSDFKDAVEYQRLGSRAGYLKIDTFVNYREPVKPAKLLEPIFSSMRKEGRDQLILDLRRNGGGSSDAQQALTSYLFDRPVRIATDARVKTLDHSGLEDYLWTWDSRAINPNRLGFRKNADGSYSLRSFAEDLIKPVKPARNNFSGELIILTSDSNSSASTSLLSLMQSEGRAKLVGEKTGGSPDGPTAGLQFTLTVPESKIRLRIPMIRYFNNAKEVMSGQGLAPDIAAPMTVAAFRDGDDPALNAAMKLIE